MLGPNALQVADLPVALKPTAGYEDQLFVSTGQYAALGELDIAAPNSGVFTASAADAALLSATPMELLAVLDTDVNCGPSDLVVTVPGTDQGGNPVTGTATFHVPSYAQNQDRVFPKCFAVQVLNAGAAIVFKTIGTPTVTNDAAANYAKLKLFGVPALSTFRQIGTKTQLNWTPPIPAPHPVQDGRVLSKWVKKGEIPVATLDITAKIPTMSDGLARINGVRVTGLIKEVKEDKVTTMHSFFLGLVLTAKPSTGESVDSATLAATGICEAEADIIAPGS